MAGEIDYEKLTRAIREGNQTGSSGVVGGGVDKAIATVIAPFQKLSETVGNNTKIFETLSSTGNSFSNNIDLMKISAANSRMSLDEFAAVAQKSSKDVAGIGGSVAKGGQAFSEFSKTFFDSGLTENLRQMGYTSKDLNEVLANQIGFQKSTTDTSVAGQIRTAQAAADLATEMDLIAKQTGKTRKEQEAALEKAKADGQIEAKMRLIGLTQGAEAEKAARENFAKQYAQAEAMGTGQVFKEMFATGTVRSQEAAMQMGLLGQAARETANSAKELSRGNVEASQTAMNSAKEGNLANQRNAALLNIAATGQGAAADVMKKNIESNDAAYHGAVKTAQAMGVAMSDVTTVLGAQKKAIQDEQQARNGATSAMIAAQNRLLDANAAANNVIRRQMMTGESNQAMQRVADTMSQGVRPGMTNRDLAEGYAQGRVRQIEAGGQGVAPTSSREKYENMTGDVGVQRAVKEADILAGGTIDAARKGTERVSNFVADVFTVRDMNIQNMQTRDEGTMGKTGMPFEPQDFFGKVAKGEMVLTPEQAQKFLAGAKTDGIQDAVQQMAKVMPKIDMNAVPGNVNISSSIQALQKSITGSTVAPQAPASAPKADRSGFQMPSMDQITIGPDGMPRITAKPQAQTIAPAVNQTTNQQNEAAKQGIMANQPQPTQATTPAPKPTATTESQDEATKLLSSLNITMNKMLAAIEESNSKLDRQVRATRSMSGNVHDRA